MPRQEEDLVLSAWSTVGVEKPYFLFEELPLSFLRALIAGKALEPEVLESLALSTTE